MRVTSFCSMVMCGLMFAGCTSTPHDVPQEPGYEPVPSPPMPMVDTTPTGSIYNSATAMELFRDIKAYWVGDVLTVLLEENTDAEMSSVTSTKKDNTNSLGTSSLFGKLYSAGQSPLEVQTSNNRAFAGSGNSSQSNRISGELTVTVHEVLANGNLLIKGEKRTTINQGMEYLRVSGIVRPEDVGQDNSVISTRIANANVAYGGRGVVGDANRAGWAARFFNSEWWPF